MRATDPSTYLRVLFSIIPKDIAVSIEIRLYIGRLCFKLSMCLAIAGKKISGI